MANKSEILYEGKAKKIFKVKGQPHQVWMEFKDSLTAFDAQKTGGFSGKGEVNLKIASLIFKYLQSRDISSHWLQDLSENEMLCKKIEIIPLEVVVRNCLAGSTAKKFGINEGTQLKRALVEFYYKKDELNDPFISDEQALVLGIVSEQKTLDQLKTQALKVNEALKIFFNEVSIDLIDFKLEFGFTESGELLLADEITPDSCRLWDQKTGEKLDKDRFRRDLGLVEKSYKTVLERIYNKWEKQL